MCRGLVGWTLSRGITAPSFRTFTFRAFLCLRCLLYAAQQAFAESVAGPGVRWLLSAEGVGEQWTIRGLAAAHDDAVRERCKSRERGGVMRGVVGSSDSVLTSFSVLRGAW